MLSHHHGIHTLVLGRPVLKEVPVKYRNQLLKAVSVDVPLSLSASLIEDAGECDDGRYVSGP
jgi:hypothetical protein